MAERDTMSNRMDAACALAVVVVVHALALVLAWHGLPVRPVARADDDTALEITWIPRRIAPRPPAAAAPRTGIETRRGRGDVMQGLSSYRVAPAAPQTRDLPAPADAAARGGAPDGAPQRTGLDLRIPEPAMRFETNPIARRGLRAAAHQDRMTLEFTDRSFGGTMQRMTKARLCADLRRSLRAADGGAYGVIEALRENGCPI